MPENVTHRGPVADMPGPDQVWARELLRTSDEGFEALWAIAADAMALSDPDGTVLLANPAYNQLYGLTPGEVLGHSFAVIFPESARAAAQAQYRAVFADPQVVPAYEATIRRGDGDTGRWHPVPPLHRRVVPPSSSTTGATRPRHGVGRKRLWDWCGMNAWGVRVGEGGS